MRTVRLEILPFVRRSAKPASILLLVAFLPLVLGCYGNFPLTKALYDFNGQSIPNKWGQSVLMGIFMILPYPLAVWGDMLIFNLIEFWSGDVYEIDLTTDGGAAGSKMVLSEDGQELTLMAPQPDGRERQIRFLRTAPGELEVLDEEGRLAGYVSTAENGDIHIQDACRGTVQVIDSATIEQIRLLRS